MALPIRAGFTVSDWFAAIQGRFDLIVANPPYIGMHELPALAPELAHEPEGALCPGDDALAAYRSILADALDHLTPGGRLVVEIGATQREEVLALFAQSGLEHVRPGTDLGGRDRLVAGSAPTELSRFVTHLDNFSLPPDQNS